MDPASWSAYSQHLSRLGASMNASSGSLPQSAQLNDLALSSTLPRQDHLPGYGNAPGPHPFLLAASHGINPGQAASRADPSFNAFVSNYDASLLSASFQPPNKSHISSFPQGLFKTVGRENDYPDLRTGFAHCGMASYTRNPDANAGLPSAAGLGSTNPLFPNSMSSASWRPTGIMPSSCGPFGILPHETVLQRSHLVRRSNEKNQGSKSSRTSLSSTTYMEQDLSRGYRGILSSPARPSSSFIDPSNVSHPSLLSPQNDPYFNSVTDNYYSSCSKADFSTYSSYCSNMQNAVQRSAISPYCYPQSYSSLESSIDKQDHSSSLNPSVSANSSFSNFVPNSNLTRSHQPNGLVPSRQTVITSNTNNYTPHHQSTHQSHSYSGSRDTYNCTSVPTSSMHSTSSSGTRSQQSNSSHHMNVSQPHYPPMSTPIPAATPAHPTPPSTIGQAHVPVVLPMSHDSGYSSLNSQSVVYNSASTDDCYSTPCESESNSPAKQEISQQSSPLGYSADSSSNLIMNQNVADSNQMDHTCRESNTKQVDASNNENADKMDNKTVSTTNASLVPSECQLVPKTNDTLSINSNSNHSAPSLSQSDMYENNILNMTQVHTRELTKRCDDALSSRSDCSEANKSNNPAFPLDSSPPVDYTQKSKLKEKRGHKRKSDTQENSYSSSFNYPPMPNISAFPTHSLHVNTDTSKDKSSSYEDSSSPSKYLLSDVSSLPVDLSNVPLSLSTKKEGTSEATTTDGVEAKSSPIPDLDYPRDILPNEWHCSNVGDSNQETKEPCAKPIESPANPNGSKPDLCTASSMEDLSDESKNKLCNNIEEDLNFLAELSAASDDDAASKESVTDKKEKKQGFLQSFLTFLESSNEPTAPSETENPQSKKEVDSEQTTEFPTLTGKDVENENELLMGEDNKDKKDKDNPEKNEEKTSQFSEEKDNFEETPSLDNGLFNCSSLQKEMVVPNPEAPSFSSDEDENSAQGIFDSVAMAIQRLCDDNDDETKPKSPSSKDSEVMKQETAHQSQDKSCVDQKENKTASDMNVSDETVPSIIVKPRKGKRKKGRHLLVIKVNKVKKENAEVSQNLKVSNKPKRKSARTKFKHNESTTDSLSRRPLMRKCKQKRFQRNCETKRKRKTRNSAKLKFSVEEQEEKEIIILDDDDDENNDEKKTVMPLPGLAKSTVIVTVESSKAPDGVLPKKVKRSIYTKRRRKRKKIQPQLLKTNVPANNVNAKNILKDTNITSAIIPSNNRCDVPKELACPTQSTKIIEPQFKTGDYVTCIDELDSSNNTLPIWRIEGKNVLQLFEAFKVQTTSVLYKNTTSYSRWSPSSKHKYSKLHVNILQSDDDTVIIEVPKKKIEDESIPLSLEKPPVFQQSEDDSSLQKQQENAVAPVLKPEEVSGAPSSDDYLSHPQRENFEVYLQTLVSHALDPQFIPEIVKENDEYFLSRIKEIETVTLEKKQILMSTKTWNSVVQTSAETYPLFFISDSQEDFTCQVCSSTDSKHRLHFHGPLYNDTTLLCQADLPSFTPDYPLCGSCVQLVSLYSRLHHHKYHFYQEGCKKVKEVQSDHEKDSHTILEECLQDSQWVLQMFQNMMELWKACDKYR